ncbi:MAG: hypothetical protein VKJ06_08220 [Vampirovibrionales bacterium]|nr:hypothetical protein [Vampirovibrionales bacterium]
MSQISREEYLANQRNAKEQNDKNIEALNKLLSILNERSEPLDVNGMSTEKFIRLKVHVLNSIEYLSEWNTRLITTLYKPYGDSGEP